MKSQHIISMLLFVMFVDAAMSEVNRGESVHAVYVMNPDGSEQHVLFPFPLDASSIAISPDGTRVAYSAFARHGFDLWVCDITGANSWNLTDSEGVSESSPSWSPDGTRIAFSSDRDGNRDVFVMDADGRNPTRVTNHPAADGSPSWSPDGKRLAFSSDRSGTAEIFAIDADGSDVEQLTTGALGEIHYGQPAWSPIGDRIAFVGVDGIKRDLYILNLSGGDAKVLIAGIAVASPPSWSPDGTSIAFAGDVLGNSDVFTLAVESERVQNLTDGTGENLNPVWLPNGQIAFVTRRSRAELNTQVIGSTYVLTIFEEGGLSIEVRNGDVAPVRLRRTKSDGSFEYVPLAAAEADRILRERGFSSGNLPF